MNDRLYRRAVTVLTGDIGTTPERLRLKLEGQGMATNADACAILLHIMAAEHLVSEADCSGLRIVFRRDNITSGKRHSPQI